jgi:transposase-like protein
MGRYSKRTNWTSGLPASHHVTTEAPQDTVRSHRVSAKKLSAAEIALLAEQYQSGATIYELAARFGIHRNTVALHLHRHGVTMRRRGLDPSEVDHAVRLYQGGQPLARIGDRYGVDPSTVHAALRTRGVRLRDTHGRPQ